MKDVGLSVTISSGFKKKKVLFYSEMVENDF